MTTVTSIPVGSTGLNLEGLQVTAGIRESVVFADPSDDNAFGAIVSTQPANQYGPAVWLQGTPNVSVAALPGVSIVSSIPFYVAQSSSPWAVNGGVAVTSNVTIQGTSSVNILGTPTVTVQGTSSVNVLGSIPGTTMVNIVSTVTQGANITSSIPFFVAQSSAPWTVNGSVSVSSQPAVSSSWPLSTTMANIVSSIPFFVAQSSGPWSFVETVSTAGGVTATTIALQGNLNTTVVKASAGQLYGVLGTNVGSSNVFVRFLNASTAATAIASTGVAVVNFGVPVSSSPFNNYDAGIAFGAGITIITQQQPFTATTSVAPTASTATVTILFK